MLSHQVIQRIEALDVAINQKELQRLLKEISNLTWEDARRHSENEAPPPSISISRSLRRFFAGTPLVSDEEVSSFVRKRVGFPSMRDLFRMLDNIEEALEELPTDVPGSMPNGPGVRGAINEFSEAFESYARNESQLVYTNSLQPSARGLLLSLRSVHDLLRRITFNLQGQITADEPQQGRLRVELDSDLTLQTFSRKLSALDSLYSELSEILAPEALGSQALVLKVESGSLFADILGYPKVIDLMVSLIRDAIDFLYRSFTTEGKISALPRKVEALDSVLQLRSKLKDKGIDVDNMDDQIQKSSVLIAEQLNCLLAGQAKVTVNQRTYAIVDFMQQKYIEESRRTLLQAGSPSISPGPLTDDEAEHGGPRNA